MGGEGVRILRDRHDILVTGDCPESRTAGETVTGRLLDPGHRLVPAKLGGHLVRNSVGVGVVILAVTGRGLGKGHFPEPRTNSVLPTDSRS